MDLKQLRYFVAVAEELHFGRAAERLFISQPALSFDIKKLESQLGIQLLIRTNKSVSLTNAGQVLLNEARNLLLQAEQARCLTLKSAQGFVGRLRVGFVNSMLYRGVPKAVSMFRQAHPEMEVMLMEMNSSEQIMALQRGQVDIGFVHWAMFPDDVTSERVLAEPFLCCLPQGHPLAQEACIDLADLRHDGFILFPRRISPHYHDLIIARCVAAGFSPKIDYETRLWQTVVTMVSYGMGVALVPETLCAVWKDGVSYRPIRQSGPSSEIHAVYSEQAHLPAVMAFLSELKAVLPAQTADA